MSSPSHAPPSARHPYPAYKDSGVVWLGKIPAHWKVKRLKFRCLLSPSKAGVRHDHQGNVSFVPMESVGEHGELVLSETRTLEDVLDGYTYFRDDDVVVAKITPCFENNKGALVQGLTSGIGFGTTELHVLRPLPMTDAQYLFYVTMSYAFRDIGTAHMQGAAGQKRVPGDFIKDFSLGFPPLPEQRTIATFLDHQTTRIDTLVEKQERLIALLHEKRTSLISHAVTKGLDPDAPMKDSGVAWLGEVPEHWEVKRLKTTVALITAKTEPTDDLPYLGLENVESWIGAISLDSETAAEGVSGSFAETDVLFGKLRPYLAKAARPPWRGYCSSEFLVMRPQDIDRGYLFWSCLSDSFVKIVTSSTYGAKMPRASWVFVGDMRVPLPPLPEQRAISGSLDRETARIDTLVGKVGEAIARLREYRTALITAAVTGKIDVRPPGRVT